MTTRAKKQFTKEFDDSEITVIQMAVLWFNESLMNSDPDRMSIPAALMTEDFMERIKSLR